MVSRGGLPRVNQLNNLTKGGSVNLQLGQRWVGQSSHTIIMHSGASDPPRRMTPSRRISARRNKAYGGHRLALERRWKRSAQKQEPAKDAQVWTGL